jgi:hypothetical protein
MSAGIVERLVLLHSGAAWQCAEAAATLAEAIARIEAQDAEIAALRAALDTLVMACELPGDHCEVEQALPGARALLARAAQETQG